MSVKAQWSVVPLTLCMLPFSRCMALSGEGAGVLQHWAYMCASANVLHWALNALAWMFLWRWVTWVRLAVAYSSAVALGYVLPSQMVCGWSVMIFFFWGFMWHAMRFSGRAQVVMCLVIPFFLPNIAAAFHTASFASGFFLHCLSRLMPHS